MQITFGLEEEWEYYLEDMIPPKKAPGYPAPRKVSKPMSSFSDVYRKVFTGSALMI